MAKLIGGVLSKGSGRLGGHVLAVSNGQQIIREYQPNVANPRTSLQKAQRAKVVLAGKLSQITPDAVIIGLAENKRDRRSEYTRNVIKNARVQEESGEYTAVLLPGSLVFSNGQEAGGVSAVIGDVTAEAVSVTPTWGDNVDAAMIVAVQYDATAEKYHYINYAMATTSGTAVMVALAGAGVNVGVNIYVIPLVRKATAGSVFSDGVNKTDNSYVGTLGFASPDVYRHMASKYIGFKAMGA